MHLNAGRDKLQQKKFVSYCHYYHLFHTPFPQRDVPVKEEVKVVRLTVTLTLYYLQRVTHGRLRH